jgi:acyl-CoA synthetase (AMP-forming)/AMP-acid ligase II
MATDTSESQSTTNVAARLSAMAARMPHAPAVVVQIPRRKDTHGRHQYERYTFQQLDRDSDLVASQLLAMGVPRGSRLALMVKPGFDFISLVFALFKAGMVQILIDPGMGRRNVLKCLDEAAPDGFVAIPIVHAVRSLLGRRYAKARWNVTVGRRFGWGGATLAEFRARDWPGATIADVAPEDPAAIIFTSGSTGPPKGVLYRHGNFNAQVEQIRDGYDIEPGGVDLACFPLFALFNGALGLTTVIPDMDATRPAKVNPRNILAAVADCGVTQSFGSPAVWNAVGQYCQQHGATLPLLRNVYSAGAPVPARVLAAMKRCIHPEGEVYTPYGATESLPVASISASEVLGETRAATEQGAGVCVGRRFSGIEWRVVRIVDGPIRTIDNVEMLPDGEIGELIVRGDVVTSEYVNLPEATARAKIADGEKFWHRMGDVGYLDAVQRFWFCGRLMHRVATAQGTMFTIVCEAIFNTHPSVFRSALVGVGPRGQQRPVMIVEPWPEKLPRSAAQRDQLLAELRRLAAGNPRTASIGDFLIHPSFPVDIRHNAKIFREKLAVWAAKQLPAS